MSCHRQRLGQHRPLQRRCYWRFGPANHARAFGGGLDFHGIWSLGSDDGADAVDGVEVGNEVEGEEGGEGLRPSFAGPALSFAEILHAHNGGWLIEGHVNGTLHPKILMVAA